jgi:hypothetical protein
MPLAIFDFIPSFYIFLFLLTKNNVDNYPIKTYTDVIKNFIHRPKVVIVVIHKIIHTIHNQCVPLSTRLLRFICE